MASTSQAAPAFVCLAARQLRWRLLTELADSGYRDGELVTLVGEPHNLSPTRLRSPRVGVLFVCASNSARSPTGEALLCHRTGGHVEVASAGSRPKPRLHPTVRVLRDEFGIDITGQPPGTWTR